MHGDSCKHTHLQTPSRTHKHISLTVCHCNALQHSATHPSTPGCISLQYIWACDCVCYECTSSYCTQSLCCSVLQCVAVCCSVLQCVAVCSLYSCTTRPVHRCKKCIHIFMMCKYIYIHDLYVELVHEYREYIYIYIHIYL